MTTPDRDRRMTPPVFTSLLVILALIILLIPAQNSIANGPPPKLSLAPTHGQAGDTVHLSGSRFVPDAAGQVLLTADDSLQGTFVTDADGRFALDVVIPALAPGQYTYAVVVEGEETGHRGAPSIDFTVDESPPPATEIPPTNTAVPPTSTNVPATSTATPTKTPNPTATATKTPTTSGQSSVVLAAGDIASCSSDGDELTAALLAAESGDILTLGDNAYESGSATEFATCYNPSWGLVKSRTHPAVGNHEYLTSGANGYYGYFGSAAGSPSKGYYSYDLGSWHLIALNSNCSQIGGCNPGSAQEQWLRADLAAHPTACTLAYWHHPLFSSGDHGNDTAVRPLFQALYDGNADLVLVGHDHDYERFAPQDAAGTADPNRGIREFVVGTGGKSHYAVSTIKTNSEVRNNDTFGVLKLTLGPTSYSWEFLPVAGKTFTDSGSTRCHDGNGLIAEVASPTGAMRVSFAPAAGYAAVADRPRGFGNA